MVSTTQNVSSAHAANRENLLAAQLEYQKKLIEITNKIHSAQDTNDILLNLQGEILSLFDADRITIYVVDGVRKQIVSRFKTGDEVNEIRVPISPESIAGYAVSTGKMVNIRDAYDKEELKRISPHLKFDSSWDKKSGYRTKQVLAAPITFNKYLLGVIQLINKKTGTPFTKEDENAVLEIAKVLGIAFYKNQKAVQRKRPTKFDYLIANNIISDKDLEQAMIVARKAKKPVESVSTGKSLDLAKILASRS